MTPELSAQAFALWITTSAEANRMGTRHAHFVEIPACLVWELAGFGAVKIISYDTDGDTWLVWLNCRCKSVTELLLEAKDNGKTA